jgi:hypothetical protein
MSDKVHSWVQTIGVMFAIGSSVLFYLDAQSTKSLEAEVNLVVSPATNLEKPFYIVFENTGPGLARIKWHKVFVDGERMATWEEVYRKFGISQYNRNFSILGPNGLYQPGVSIELLLEKDYAAAQILKSNVHRIVHQLCVCTIYDECHTEIRRNERFKDFGSLRDMQGSCIGDEDYPIFFRAPDSMF